MPLPASTQSPGCPRMRGVPTHTEPCALAGEVVHGGVSLQVQFLQLRILTAPQHLEDTPWVRPGTGAGRHRPAHHGARVLWTLPECRDNSLPWLDMV